MDVARLAYLLSDLTPSIEEIDGYLFFDRFDDGVVELKTKISKYASAKEAQSWINIVLLDRVLTEILGDWEFNDPGIDDLLTICRRAWTAQVTSAYPNAKFKIEMIADEDAGDLGLRLIQD